MKELDTPGALMRRARFGLGAGLIVAALAPSTHAAVAGIERVAWLQGCWELAADGRTVEEQWMGPCGGAMIGQSRTVKSGAMIEFEFVVIRERGEHLVYHAHPSGQPAAEFVSTTVSGNSVVFENPGHDFPQRIGYERRGSSLKAWIEGSMRGQARKIEFPYQRVSCPAGTGNTR